MAESTLVSKGPCPSCGSSDANALYDDGHTHCFSCGKFVGPKTSDRHRVKQATGSPRAAADGLLSPGGHPKAWDDLEARGLKSETLKRYGYFRAGYAGKTVQVAPYTDARSRTVKQKLRFPDKTFVVLGEEGPGITECQLFGQSLWGDKFDRRVVVTEGEIDAMSVAQATGFKVPAVSISGGAKAAVKSCKANYLWLDRYAEIILWFDDDEPGREAAEEVAALFKVGKVKLAKVPGDKDASDTLKAGRPGDITEAVFSAAVWRPRGIINARDRVQDVLAPKEKVLCWAYPEAMKKLQEMTGGIHLGEVIYHVAGTGVGKSAALREIQHCLVKQGVKIAVLSFEDTVRDAKFGLMSIEVSERLHLAPVPEPDDAKGIKSYDAKMTKVHDAVFGSGLVELFDPETAEWSMEAILGYVRYCARGLDCKVVFIDPLSFVASGIELTADERRVLDRVAAEFAKLAKELGINIQISHHLKRTSGVPHEEGAPTSLNELRSSGGLANFAMGVIGWERNTQAEGDAWRVTQSRVIKALRRTGKSGLADTLYYGENGRLVPSTIPFPPIGKPEGQTKGERPQFSNASETDY